MDDYLKLEYGYVTDHNIEDVTDIERYFYDNGAEYFECGQGYYEDDVTVNVLVEGRCFRVNLMADVLSAKQDRGDRLYWVEDITNVLITEVEKPLPKSRTTTTITFESTEDAVKDLYDWFKSQGIKEYSIIK